MLPLPYSRIAQWINRVLMVQSLRRWMRAVDFSRPVIWTFLPTPLAHELINHLDPSLTIYYCIDDLASSSPEARKITSSEQAMFRRADLVFVTSEKLRQKASRDSSKVHFFPFAVRFQSFEEARLGPRQAPDDIASLPRPVVGYVGGMHQWIDQDLAADVARRLPDVTFAYVGPPQCDLSRLEACPNIKLLGGKPHAMLPHYIREFDVGLVPYRLSDYTSNVYPTKLNEYLVDGRARRGHRSRRDPALQRRSRRRRVDWRDGRGVCGGDSPRAREVAAGGGRAPHRDRALEQLGIAHREDVGADRGGRRHASATRKGGGTSG